jgi:transcriptional regulator with XRE-family HTH domain
MTIGEHLKKLRNLRQITLDEAAQQTGVSKPMLSQIERGVSSPTVNTLWKIATGLKVPLSYFLSEPEADYEVKRSADAQIIAEDSNRMRAHSIFSFDPLRNFETFFITFDPRCHHPSEGHMDGVEEYIFVYSGRLTLRIQEKTVILETGDAIRFRADVPHCYANVDAETCRIHNMIFYPAR